MEMSSLTRDGTAEPVSRDQILRQYLRVPVGTPTADRKLPLFPSPSAAREYPSGSCDTESFPVMPQPFSPPMSRGQPRAPLSTMQQASGDFQSPGAKRTRVAERLLTGGAAPGPETASSREALRDIAGGAVRVVTTPVKGIARHRSNNSDDRRKSAGIGDKQPLPGLSRLKGHASTAGVASHGAAAHAATSIEENRRRSGGEYAHLVSRDGAVPRGDGPSRAMRGREDNTTNTVSGGSLGPPLRELRRVSIAHCNLGIAGRRDRGVGEIHRRKSTQEASSNGDQRSSDSAGAMNEQTSRRVSTWSSSSTTSTGSRRSSGEGSSDGAGNKRMSSTVELPSRTGGSTSKRETRRVSTRSSTSSGRESTEGEDRNGAARGESSKREREGECEECQRFRRRSGRVGDGREKLHEGLCEKCAANAQAPVFVDPLRNDAGVRPCSKRPRKSVIMESSRRSSVSGEGAAAISVKGVGSADGAQGDDCDTGKHLRIGHFDVFNSLGKGKFGRVYRAKAKQSSKSKIFALKMLMKSTLNEASRQEQINVQREIDIQTKLSHANIVRMVTWFQDPKWFYLVLDYASGGDVYKALRRNGSGLPHDIATRYLRDAVSAVAYLHENHVIHRDIKPENLLLDSQGRLKLSDFGCAVHAVPPQFHERQTLCGTPVYVAPEMLVLSPKYTYQVDIWSLGVLAYELLAGKTPFDSTSVDEDMDSMTSVAAEIEAVHKGDRQAQLYGRIVSWNGSPESLFGEGTRGENIPVAARDVVLAMLRPIAEERLETREVLRLPWLASADQWES